MSEIKVPMYNFVKQLLRISCVLPKSKDDKTYKYKFYGIIMPLYLLGLFSLLLHIWYTLTQVLRDDTKDVFVELILQDLMVLLVYSAILHCVVCTYSNNETLMDLINDLEDFTRFGLPPNIDHLKTNSKKMILVIFFYYLSVVTLFLTYGIINSRHCEDLNELYDLNTLCAYINYAWYPIDLNYTPVKQIIASLLGIAAFPLVLTAVGAAAMICCSLINVVERIQHFKQMLYEALAIKNMLKCRNSLIRCYEYYEDLERLMLKVNTTFSTLLLMYTCLCGMIIGLSGYQFLLIQSMQSMVLIVGWTPVLYYISYRGQDLKSESLTISDELFGMNWYEKDVRIQKEIKFLLLALKKPLVLSIPGFGSVDLTTFSVMMKVAYNSLTVFYQTL